MDSLREEYEKGKQIHRGPVTVVDVSGMEAFEYGRTNQTTVLPRSGPSGGVEGGDKYGDGIVKRELDENFNVVKVVEDFKPGPPVQPAFDEELVDAVPQQQQPPGQSFDALGSQLLDLAREEGAPVQQPQQPQQQPQTFEGAVAQPDLGMLTAPAAEPGQAMTPEQMARTIQELHLSNQALVQQLTEKKAPPPPPAPPTRPPGRIVSFLGPWGKISARYQDVIMTPDCIVLVQNGREQQTYEPPVSLETTLEVFLNEADNMPHRVRNVGLSFDYKGDKLIILIQETRNDPQAE